MAEAPVAAAAPDLVIRDGTAALASAAADWIADQLRAAIRERGGVSIALAGGRTPVPAYHELARRDGIDWSRVDVYFGDERAVPPDDPESNYAMAREALLTRVPIPAERVHRMEAERPDREAAADDYARQLPSRLDLILLGTGPDGHTCSLFPGAAALSEARRTVIPVRGPKPPPDRLTITPPVIRQGRRLALLAQGSEKAPAIARALAPGATTESVPVALARRGTWFLDRAAAALLPGGGR